MTLLVFKWGSFGSFRCCVRALASRVGAMGSAFEHRGSSVYFTFVVELN